MNVYRHIDREKIQFDFLATDDGGDSFKSEIIKLGGRVYTIPRNKINNLPYLVKKLHNLVKDKHYTIIHYHATSQWVVALLGVKRLGVKKIIIHSHAPYYSDSFAKSIRNALISLPIFMEGTTFVAVSEEAGRGLFFRKSFQVIANSIDLKRFKYCERDRVYIRKKLSCCIIIGLTFEKFSPTLTYLNYSNYIDNSSISAGYLGLILNICIIIFLLIISFFAYQNRDIKLWEKYFPNNSDNLLPLIMVISIGIYFISFNLSQFSRITLYFEIASLIYIPDVIQTVESKKIKLFMNVLVYMVLFSYFFIVLICRPEWSQITPYYF